MKILVTGASGTIGGVLLECLSKRHDVVGIDNVTSKDVITLDIVNEREKLRELLCDVDVVIHLAWNVREAGTTLDVSVPENKVMGEIMYALSLEQKVKKFLLASSVHVSLGHINYKTSGIVEDHKILHEKKITTRDKYFPLGIYGASKVYLEALGRAYSEKGLQVVAVRFGNVTDDNNFGEYPFWLSHRDCCQFVEKCIEASNLPRYSVFFAISDNPCNPFDLSEAWSQFGYEPKDRSECPNSK